MTPLYTDLCQGHVGGKVRYSTIHCEKETAAAWKTSVAGLEGAVHKRVQVQDMLLTSLVESFHIVLVLTGIPVSRLSRGREMTSTSSFFLEVFLKSLSFSTSLEISKQISLPCAAGIFQLLLLCYISTGLFCAISLRAETQFLLTFWLSQSQVYGFFKGSAFKPHKL